MPQKRYSRQKESRQRRHFAPNLEAFLTVSQERSWSLAEALWPSLVGNFLDTWPGTKDNSTGLGLLKHLPSAAMIPPPCASAPSHATSLRHHGLQAALLILEGQEGPVPQVERERSQTSQSRDSGACKAPG